MSDSIFKQMGSVVRNAIDSKTLTWVLKTENYTASAFEAIACDTVGGIFTLTLPSSPSIGDKVMIVDASYNFGNYNLIVARNNISGGELSSNATVYTVPTGKIAKNCIK